VQPSQGKDKRTNKVVAIKQPMRAAKRSAKGVSSDAYREIKVLLPPLFLLRLLKYPIRFTFETLPRTPSVWQPFKGFARASP